MFAYLSIKQILKYSVMPEFLTRLRSLVGSGFQNVAYLVAVVYNLVRLLPDNHPYLNARNIGRFGIRHVIAEAANNLVLSRKNIDQIILFLAILIGMVMLCLQLFLLASSIFLQPVFAGTWGEYFVVAEPRQDIAYIMLDLVFGVPHADYTVAAGGSFFESCVGWATPCLDSWGLPIMDADFSQIPVAVPTAATISPISVGEFSVFPFPIHIAMMTLFGLYNWGLMVVAIIIASYFIVTVVAETAQSGTPFGKRYNKLWAPIRIVMAFGLLMPLPTLGGVVDMGYNSAQYIVLYAAKYGSAFATNGWIRFQDTLNEELLAGDVETLLSTPTAPEIENLTLFMWLVNVCYHTVYYQSSSPTVIVQPYVIGRTNRPGGNTLDITTTTTLNDVYNFLDPKPKVITIRFGRKSEKDYPKEDGFVKPICGEIQVPLTDPRPLPEASLGVDWMQSFYFNLVRDMWFESSATSPYTLTQALPTVGGNLRSKAFAYNEIYKKYEDADYDDPLDRTYVSALNSVVTNLLDAQIRFSVQLQGTDPSWALGPCASGDNSTLIDKGWGAAGIWYNCLAEMNGSMTTAVNSVPNASRFPQVMEDMAALKAQYNSNSGGADLFQPVLSGVSDPATQLNLGSETQAAAILYKAQRQWMAGMQTTQTKSSNPVTAAIATFFGVNGLYDMRQNQNVHPLAQLVGIGRALVEAAVRKMGYALGFALASNALDGADGGLTGLAANMLVTFAMLGLTAGFTLFYIVPFLPFIYFFFALGGWVKGIFEAMVGAPLWALAHIRIDGHGLPGSAAMNGYFLIFEIFIRPILTLFGLLASVTIFAALVGALNNIFDLVVSNATGFNIGEDLAGDAADSMLDKMRGTLDEFFFTIIYAVIVYMMAMSSFKLIDQIPNNILRWMGQSVATFGDTREDPAAGLMSRVSGGAQQAFSRMGSGLSGVVGAISGPSRK